MSFSGRRVLALESRRSTEIAELIRRQGGESFVAPAMCEVPLEPDEETLRFAERLFAGEFDMLILLTGVGTRQLRRVLAQRYSDEAFVGALGRLTVVARGPKPVSALREMGLTPALTAPEPNTWRELVAITEGRPERRIAVQEYGRPIPALYEALAARGAEVTPVSVYRYGLPEDTRPLREAALRLAAGDFAVVIFTSAYQLVHLLRVADETGVEDEVRHGLDQAMVCSIGPTTTEALEDFAIRVDFQPSHPKMGFLVKEASDRLGG
jgi:uroporphyrinogen-III synthase